MGTFTETAGPRGIRERFDAVRRGFRRDSRQ
ncbi:hypothetical protein EES43_00585 [Streptomyces sp. ADI96-02]|nr:hypothetical protein EES43_00585 [Streptomyces sp. ADI96-02]